VLTLKLFRMRWVLIAFALVVCITASDEAETIEQLRTENQALVQRNEVCSLRRMTSTDPFALADSTDPFALADSF